MPQLPNPVRTLPSYGVEDQTSEEWQLKKACPQQVEGIVRGTHHMVSVKTGAPGVPWVEQCQNCGWIDAASLQWWADNAVKMSLAERAQRIAVAVDTEPFAFVQRPDEELTLDEVLGQALGAASTCWSEKQVLQAGEFNGSRAAAIYRALRAEVERFMKLDRQAALQSLQEQGLLKYESKEDTE